MDLYQIVSNMEFTLIKSKIQSTNGHKSLDGLNLINKPSYQVMEEILKQFCKLTYNKKTKTYTVK